MRAHRGSLHVHALIFRDVSVCCLPVLLKTVCLQYVLKSTRQTRLPSLVFRDQRRLLFVRLDSVGLDDELHVVVRAVQRAAEGLVGLGGILEFHQAVIQRPDVGAVNIRHLGDALVADPEHGVVQFLDAVQHLLHAVVELLHAVHELARAIVELAGVVAEEACALRQGSDALVDLLRAVEVVRETGGESSYTVACSHCTAIQRCVV